MKNKYMLTAMTWSTPYPHAVRNNKHQFHEQRSYAWTMLIKKRLEWCFIPKIPRTVQTLWLHEERTPRAFHKDSLEILCMRYNLIWIAVDLMKDDEY